MIRQIKNFLDKTLEFVVIVSVAVLVLTVLWQVFTRKVLNDPSEWTEELSIFLLIWVVLLGAAVALSLGAHLGIDYFVGKLSQRKQIFTEIVVFVLILAFAFFVMLYGGFYLVKSILELGQVSPVLGVGMNEVKYQTLPPSIQNSLKDACDAAGDNFTEHIRRSEGKNELLNISRFKAAYLKVDDTPWRQAVSRARNKLIEEDLVSREIWEEINRCRHKRGDL